MQDRPRADELLGAAAALLATDISGAVPREQRFSVLIAANVCAMVARELELGPAHDAVDRELFAGLLGSGRNERPSAELAVELAARIRSGDLDGELERVAAGLREHVARKLEIARPGYAE